MRHLTPSSFPSHHSITPPSISLYTFLPFSPTTCIPHVALNPGVERACIVYSYYRIILQKRKKALLKILNVDLTTINVAPNVALNPALEQACILCRLSRTIFSKTHKSLLETRNVVSDVALNPGTERPCRHLLHGTSFSCRMFPDEVGRGFISRHASSSSSGQEILATKRSWHARPIMAHSAILSPHYLASI
jgi:hypothetical protein